MAAQSSEPPIFLDGFTTFENGLNSGVAPLLLPRNQLSFAINCTVRGSYVTHRPPYKLIPASFTDGLVQAGAEQGIWQGGCYYISDEGVASLVTQISGRLFKWTPATDTVDVSEVTISGDPNPADTAQAWLWQAEKWVIVNDGASVPIFYDGTISRRSDSDQIVLGTVDAAGFIAPNVGATVVIPLTTPFLGQIGQSFFISSGGPSNGSVYQATYPAATPNATVTTLVDPSATEPIGTQVIINPNIFGVQLTNVSLAAGAGTHAPNTFSITLTMDKPTTVAIGSKTTILGKVWVVTAVTSPFVLVRCTQTITILATDSLTAGQVYLKYGSTIPITILGTLVTAFVPPPIGTPIDIEMSTPYGGTNGQEVLIGTGHYTIAQKPSPPPGLSLTAININDTPLNAVVAGDTLLSIPELPPGRMGAYGLGRNWMSLTDGRRFLGSDIVGATSGTVQNQFRDSVLKTTENTFLAGGGYFIVPGNVGNITAMIFTATLDSSLGQGPLQVFTPNIVFSVNAPVDRTTWAGIENPILTQSLISNGALGQNSTIQWNNDTMYRAVDGIRSLILGRREFATWGNVPISHEVERIIAQDDPELLQFGSAEPFDNRMLMTSKPVSTSQGVTNRGLIALNAEPMTSLGEKSPSVYDGLWTGLNTLQIIRGRFGGNDRCFAFSYNNKFQRIELYEILTDGTDDFNGELTRIVWQFETGCAFRDVKGKNVLDLCKLIDGELYVGEVKGRVGFEVFYRSQFDPCWHRWTAFSICANDTAENARMQNRVTLGLGKPPLQDSCDTQNNRSTFVGETFQFKVIVTGHCRVYGALFKACGEPRSFFAKPVCGDQECRLISCPPEDDYGVYELQDRSPTPPPPDVFNEAVSHCVSCSGLSVLMYNGTLPAWITLNDTTNCLNGAAGIFRAPTQAQANGLAQTALDDFVSTSITAGTLVCQSSSPVIFVPDDTTGWTAADFADAFVENSGLIYAIGGRPVAPFIGNFYSSVDGLAWTLLSAANLLGDEPAGLAFGAGLYVTGSLGQGRIWTSPTGAVWTQLPMAGDQFYDAIFAGGKFVVVGNQVGNGRARWSTDGITWNAATIPFTGATKRALSVTYAFGLYFAAGHDEQIFSSPDAITWTNVYTGGGADRFNSIAFINGLLIAVGTHRKLATSTDGTIWTPLTAAVMNINEEIVGIAGNNRNYLVATANFGGIGRAYESFDFGVTWALLKTDSAGRDAITNSMLYSSSLDVLIYGFTPP